MARRYTFIFPLLLLALLNIDVHAVSQDYPNRLIRIVVPFPAGGGLDIVARAVAQGLSATFSQSVVVDNRSGADGMIGTDQVAKAAPDGYTLLMSSTGPMVINAALNSKMPYHTLRDFAPVTLVVTQPIWLVIHRSLPVKSVQEIIALAKAKPGQLNYGSNGIGSGAHLAGEMFKWLTLIDVVHVPYKGAAPAVTDLVAGQVQMMFNSISVMSPHVKAGKLRALAVGADHRMAIFSEVPTMREAGVPQFNASSWYGFFAPALTPNEIVSKLNTECVKILRGQEIRDFLLPQGAEAVGNSPEEFSTHIKSELAKWAQVVKSIDAKPH